MISFLRHLFQNGAGAETDDAFKNRATQVAQKSEEALTNNQNTIAALDQIRRVEQIAKEEQR